MMKYSMEYGILAGVVILFFGFVLAGSPPELSERSSFVEEVNCSEVNIYEGNPLNNQNAGLLSEKCPDSFSGELGTEGSDGERRLILVIVVLLILILLVLFFAFRKFGLKRKKRKGRKNRFSRKPKQIG